MNPCVGAVPACQCCTPRSAGGSATTRRRFRREAPRCEKLLAGFRLRGIGPEASRDRRRTPRGFACQGRVRLVPLQDSLLQPATAPRSNPLLTRAVRNRSRELARRTRQTDRQRGASLALGRRRPDGSAMRTDNLLRDEQAETQSARGTATRAPMECLEQDREEIRRNQRTLIADFENDDKTFVERSHSRRSIGISAVNRVRNQVSNELREAVRIPFAGATPCRVEAKIACPGWLAWISAPATSGEIEELVDHAQCARPCAVRAPRSRRCGRSPCTRARAMLPVSA
jgi:hypothetical protein